MRWTFGAMAMVVGVGFGGWQGADHEQRQIPAVVRPMAPGHVPAACNSREVWDTLAAERGGWTQDQPIDEPLRQDVARLVAGLDCTRVQPAPIGETRLFDTFMLGKAAIRVAGEHAEAGREREAARLLIDVIGVGQDLRHGPVVSLAVGTALEKLAIEALAELPLDPAHRAELAPLLLASIGREPPVDLREERLWQGWYGTLVAYGPLFTSGAIRATEAAELAIGGAKPEVAVAWLRAAREEAEDRWIRNPAVLGIHEVLAETVVTLAHAQQQLAVLATEWQVLACPGTPQVAVADPATGGLLGWDAETCRALPSPLPLER